jgi:hypothetical protein
VDLNAIGDSGTPPDDRTAIQSVQYCFVFDPSDGEIQHVHSVVTMEGADETSDDELMQRALSLARERLATEGGTYSGDLEAILVDPTDLKPVPYRVDVQNRSLIETQQTSI